MRAAHVAASALLFSGLAGLSAPTRADVIYSPVVEEGEAALEWRSTVNAGGAEEHKLELEYSPTAWWTTEVLTTADRDPGAARQLTEVSFENVISLNPQGRDWADLGVLGELSRSLRGNHAWALELGLLGEHATAHTVTAVNLSAEKELLPGAEAEWVAAARWRWRLRPTFEPGVEYHADLGTTPHFGPIQAQRHSIGPSALGRFRLAGATLRYEAAWVIGLTRGSPASTARLQLEWEFH